MDKNAFNMMVQAVHEKKQTSHAILSEYLAAIGERILYINPVTKLGWRPRAVFIGSVQVSLFQYKKFSAAGKSQRDLREKICASIIRKIIGPHPNPYDADNNLDTPA
jgi:hypothetical protein